MRLLRDVAIRHLVTVTPEHSLRRASLAMTDRGVGCAIVVEREDVVGIITERDILHAAAGGADFEQATVTDAMTRGVVSGQPGWDLLKAIRTMHDGGFRHLLVMEMDDPVGIVSLRDLMDAMAEMVEAQEASA